MKSTMGDVNGLAHFVSNCMSNIRITGHNHIQADNPRTSCHQPDRNAQAGERAGASLAELSQESPSVAE